MDVMTCEHSCLARSTSARCPACNAPMVGIRPMMRFSARASRARSFIQAMVRMVSTEKGSALRDSGARGDGALAIEMHQVGEDRLRAVLPQHGGDLAAMVGAVIHDVLQRLPQRIVVHAEFHGLVFQHAIEIFLRQPANKIQQSCGLDWRPVLAQAVQRRQIARCRAGRKASGPENVRAKPIPRRKCAPACRARKKSWSPWAS